MKKKDVKTTSETPIKDGIPTAYDLGAERANKEPLEQSDFWSTADSNMANQRNEAHREALHSEADHYQNSHPYPEPQTEFFEVPPETQRQPTRSYRDTQTEMSMILARRRKTK